MARGMKSSKKTSKNGKNSRKEIKIDSHEIVESTPTQMSDFSSFNKQKLELPKIYKIKKPPGAGIKARPKQYDKKDDTSNYKNDDYQNHIDDFDNIDSEITDIEYFSNILDIDKDILERYEIIYKRIIRYDYFLGQINYLWINELIEVSNFEEEIMNNNELDDEDEDETYYV